MGGAPSPPAAFNVAVKLRKWAKSKGIQVIHGLNDLKSTPHPTCKNFEMYAGIINPNPNQRSSKMKPIVALRMP